MYQIVSKLIYMPKICIGNMRHALILFIKSLPVDIFCICKDWWKTYLSRTKYNNRFPVYLIFRWLHEYDTSWWCRKVPDIVVNKDLVYCILYVIIIDPVTICTSFPYDVWSTNLWVEINQQHMCTCSSLHYVNIQWKARTTCITFNVHIYFLWIFHNILLDTWMHVSIIYTLKVTLHLPFLAFILKRLISCWTCRGIITA